MLHYLERPAASGLTKPWLLVLMHGVGSNEADLFGLAPYVPPQCHVLSLRAPFTVGPQAYAWFEFDVLPGGQRRINASQELESRALLATQVPQHAARLGVPPERVILGGFSQGGIMALSLLLTQPQLLRAAMVMHSRLLPEIEGQIVTPEKLQSKHLWLSHGLQDAVIPLANAKAIAQRAQAWPLELRYAEFPGGHEISQAELVQAMAWVNAVSGAA
jgi:phospholipase/carboxylesterase